MEISEKEVSRLLLLLERQSYVETEYLQDIWHLAYLRDLGFIDVDIEKDKNTHRLARAYACRITKRGFDYLAQIRAKKYCLTDGDVHDRDIAENLYYESQRTFDHTLGTLSTGGVALSFGIASALGVQKECVAWNHCVLSAAIVSWVGSLVVMLMSYRSSADHALRRMKQIDAGERLKFDSRKSYPVKRRNIWATVLFGVGCALLAVFIALRLEWHRHDDNKKMDIQENRSVHVPMKGVACDVSSLLAITNLEGRLFELKSLEPDRPKYIVQPEFGEVIKRKRLKNGVD